MKVTVDVDCTPEEARRFLGLPDLTPVHQVYVERLAKLAGDQNAAENFAELAKSWGPMSDAGLAMWRQLVEQMSGRKP